ncbi:MAG: hypothetical protein WC494_03630 [Candidatus Pacearchaeota archaeon]
MKKGAIELSIGTIVIVVLAMSMLILGLVLVKNIFSGSTDNILIMNEKTKDEINKLFVEDKKTVVYLSNQIAKIEQGEDWGVAFGIKNLERGTTESGQFNYEVKVSDPDVKKKCGVDESVITDWIKTGRTDSISLSPGETYYGIVRFMIPKTSPLCTIRFHIVVQKDGTNYATDFFDIDVLG